MSKCVGDQQVAVHECVSESEAANERVAEQARRVDTEVVVAMTSGEF